MKGTRAFEKRSKPLESDQSVGETGASRSKATGAIEKTKQTT